MRILCVIDNLNAGGAQRQMVNLALGLHNRGNTIDLFCYATGDALAAPLRAAGVPIVNYHKRGRYSPSVIFALRNQLRRGEYDMVLSYLTTPNVYAVLATHSMVRRLRLVVSERSYDPPHGPNFRQTLLRQLYRFTDRVVVNSHHQRQNFENRYPWLRGRVTMIYNGVDLARFVPPACEPADEPFKLIVIGSVSPLKNGLSLVEALIVLRDKYQIRPQVSWVGRHVYSSVEGSTYFQEMEAAIDSGEVRSQWVWLNERDDIPTLLGQHHALVLPSRWEGLPNVVCEALACGRPVIVSNTLDHPFLVQEGITGYLFDWQDSQNLAAAIYALYQMSAQARHEMGLNGRRFAEQHLSLERLVSDYENLFAKMVA
jgi:GalNAc-alpha-(1->4)-GalNAc-alpha-(1->3)-diNAcBac-PP-undecaprenol alpha-1,4-N-acetyl-D-galactosaminyltransferase